MENLWQLSSHEGVITLVCTLGNKDQNKSHFSEILPKVGYISANEEKIEIKRGKNKTIGLDARNAGEWQVATYRFCEGWDVGEISETGSWAANSLTRLPKKYLI